jgi:hypothetical protein
MSRSDTATERFIDAENVILFRRRLTETIDPGQRLQLLRLLAEQEAKNFLMSKEKQVASGGDFTASRIYFDSWR